MESFNTRLTPKKEYPEPKADQDLTGVLKDILINPSISQDFEYFKLNGQKVRLQDFAFTLYSEVLEHLFTYGYSSKELKNRPDRLQYELIDAINEVVMYGEEINTTFFEVKTLNHFRTITEVMETISILLEE